MQWFFGMDVRLQALLASLMTYLVTALGAGLVFFPWGLKKGALTAMTGGAAGIMLAASFFSLLLPALESDTALPIVLPVTLGFVLGGAFLAVLGGITSAKGVKFGGLGRGNGLMYLAVTLHNIPEGMAVGVAFAAGAGDVRLLTAALLFAVGIAVQNFPEGACVAFPLRAAGMSRGKAFFLAQASGAVEIPACVLGAVAATFIGGFLPWALSFSAGAMVAVVCAELIPESYAGNKTVASLSLLAGFSLMMLLDIALG